MLGVAKIRFFSLDRKVKGRRSVAFFCAKKLLQLPARAKFGTHKNNIFKIQPGEVTLKC